MCFGLTQKDRKFFKEERSNGLSMRNMSMKMRHPLSEIRVALFDSHPVC
jgi:hypothetical protein